MIQVSSLSKAFGDRVLFENVDWQISKRDRIGLCGANGSGKTTLLRMLVGEEEPDDGSITRPNALTIGYLPQDGITHAGLSVFEEASLAFQPLLELKSRMHQVEERLADANVPAAEHEKMLDQYSELQDQFRREEGYSIDLKVATVMRGLGFSQADFERETSTLSGGWQMRLALAKLLLGRRRSRAPYRGIQEMPGLEKRRICTYPYRKEIRMTTKLTLSVDRKVVVRAKRYAARRKTSVSRLVEEYLDLVSRTSVEAPAVDDPPVLRLLRGVAQGVDPEDYGRYLMRKYR